MDPRDRINAALKALSEVSDSLELLTLDDSLKEQSDSCQNHANIARYAVVEAMAELESARDRYRGQLQAVPSWAEDTQPLAV